MRFAIENTSGARVDLSGEILLTDVYGLGYSDDNNAANLRNGFFRQLTHDNDGQTSLGGVLHFRGTNPYNQYLNFCDFTAQSQRLYFIYCPQNTEYRREITVKSISKSEMTNTERIADFDTLSLTPWYVPESTPIGLLPFASNALIFDVSAFDLSVFVGSIYQGISVEVMQSGQIASALRLTMHGAITNPVISIVGSTSGANYGQAEITGTINADEGLILDTTVSDRGIWKINSDGTLTDYISHVNLWYDPFPSVPVTEPCFLQVYAEDGTSGIVGHTEATIYRYFRTV